MLLSSVVQYMTNILRTKTDNPVVGNSSDPTKHYSLLLTIWTWELFIQCVSDIDVRGQKT